MRALHIVSWNVHWGVARVPDVPRSSRFDPLATLGDDILRAADVVVFPESWRPHEGPSFLDRLAEFGFTTVAETRYCTLEHGPRKRIITEPGDGWWELAIATRLPVVARTELPLARTLSDAVPTRRAISLRVVVDDTEVDVTAFHVSSKLWWAAPVVQLRSLAAALHATDRDGTNRPAVIAGDANLWRSWLPVVLPGWRHGVRGRTFPSWRPHSQIDHVLVRGSAAFESGHVLDYSPTSDHRAIRATVRLASTP